MTQPSPSVVVQPTPFVWRVSHVDVPGFTDTLVVLQVGTVIGELALFPSPDEAEAIAAALTQHAREARSGLITAAPADLAKLRERLNGNGHGH